MTDKVIQDLSIDPNATPARILLPEWSKPYRLTTCAYVASLYSIGVGYPLDSIKTRQQTYKYKNVWQCVLQTYKHEGLGGFYRGITAPLLSSSVMRTMSVSTYSYALPYTTRFCFDIYSPPTDSSSMTEHIVKTAPAAFLAGSIAGMVCTNFSAPFEFTKIASQIDLLIQQSKVPSSTWKVARDLVKRSGFFSLWSGFRYTVARDLLGTGLYFTVYDELKYTISTMMGTKDHALGIAIGGGLAGTVSWTIIYPIDTLKSLVQRDMYARSLGIERPERNLKLSKMISTKMYRGLGVSLIRTSVMGAMFFSSYEWLIKMV